MAGIDFFDWNLPPLDINFAMEKSVPVFDGINAVFGGDVDVLIDLDFGYDSSGIVDFMQDTSAANLDKLFEGFYLRDFVDPANDPDEASFELTVFAGASIGLAGLVEAGVDGGLTGKVGLNFSDQLDDPEGDGKIYFKDFKRVIEGPTPYCIFDLDGELDVFLSAFVWVGLNLGITEVTLFQDSITFIRETLVSFDLKCKELADPVLAVYDENADTLRLNVGAFGDDPRSRLRWRERNVYPFTDRSA